MESKTPDAVLLSIQASGVLLSIQGFRRFAFYSRAFQGSDPGKLSQVLKVPGLGPSPGLGLGHQGSDPAKLVKLFKLLNF